MVQQLILESNGLGYHTSTARSSEIERNSQRSCLCASGMKDFTRVNCVAQGSKKRKKKKNQVRAISALESSLSKKIMKWEKGRNMPCGSQKDKRKHQSLANKKQTMAWSQSASFGQSCLWRWVGSIGHCRIEPWLLQEQGLLLLLSWMRSGPALLCFPPGKLSCFAQGHQTSCQQICLHCCHRFRLP